MTIQLTIQYSPNDYTIDYIHSQMTIQLTIHSQMTIQLTMYIAK